MHSQFTRASCNSNLLARVALAIILADIFAYYTRNAQFTSLTLNFFLGIVFSIFALFPIIEAKYRKTVIYYPEDTQFFVTDFFVKGCKNFLDKCPKAYK